MTECACGDAFSIKNAALIILQQPLDVIKFDLRALRIGEAAAEFFQNAANPLHIDFTGDLHRVIIAVFVPVQRPSERIGAIGTALLPADAVDRTSPRLTYAYRVAGFTPRRRIASRALISISIPSY